jgi:hypothetical protein
MGDLRLSTSAQAASRIAGENEIEEGVVMIWRPLFVVLAVLFGTPSLAAEPPLFPEVTLSPEKVEAVLAAYSPMRDHIEDLGTRFEADGNAADFAQRLAGLGALATASATLDGTAQEHGFDDYMDWLGVTYAVFLAHGFAEHPEVDDDLQKALDEIEEQDGLSAAQKEQMRQMLLHSMGALAAMRPPEENIAAVTPYRDEIEAILME